MVFPVNNEAKRVSTVALDSLSTRINHWLCVKPFMNVEVAHEGQDSGVFWFQSALGEGLTNDVWVGFSSTLKYMCIDLCVGCFRYETDLVRVRKRSCFGFFFFFGLKMSSHLIKKVSGSCLQPSLKTPGCLTAFSSATPTLPIWKSSDKHVM